MPFNVTGLFICLGRIFMRYPLHIKSVHVYLVMHVVEGAGELDGVLRHRVQLLPEAGQDHLNDDTALELYDMPSHISGQSLN